jgi:Uma2 family endonuclease
MSVSAKTYVTPEEYLAAERVAPTKSEYLDGEVLAMAGASPRHTLIAMNVGAALHFQLRSKPCTVHGSDLRVRVAERGLYAYPDVVVVCGEMEYDDQERDTVTNPKVLIEVLSKSTEAHDRGIKADRYRRTPSLSDFLLIAQDNVRVERYERQASGLWLISEATSLNDTIRLDAIECKLALADVYAKVNFDA